MQRVVGQVTAGLDAGSKASEFDKQENFSQFDKTTSDNNHHMSFAETNYKLHI